MLRRNTSSRTLLMNKYLFIIGFCLLPWLVYGDVYQWVDKDGTVHFGSIPPQQQEKYNAGDIKYHSAPVLLKKDLSKKELSEQGGATQESPGVESANSKNKPFPKNSKFRDRKELEMFVEHLQEKVKSYRVGASPEIDKKLPASKNVKMIRSEPDDKDKVTVKAGAEASLAADEKKVSSQEGSEASSKRDADTENIATQKDADKCGVFTGFVDSYEIKVAEECPGAHCSVYKRSLKRYKLKQKRYC